MKYKIFPPSDELRGIVKYFVVIDSLQNIESLLFLPNGGNFIIFNRGIKASSKSFCNNESLDIPQTYSVSAKTNHVKSIVIDSDYKYKDDIFPIIMVELLPTGFYKLFNKDAFLLNSTYIEIDKDIVNKYFSKLYNHKSVTDELDYLNRSLAEMNNSQCNTRLCIEDVVEKITHDYFDVKVKDLLSEFGCSRSTMERQFKKVVGLTPKKYILIAKFCKTFLEYVEDKRTFNEIQYIYSDNSHMNLLFQTILGISPSEIFAKVAKEELYVYQINNLKSEKSDI